MSRVRCGDGTPRPNRWVMKISGRPRGSVGGGALQGHGGQEFTSHPYLEWGGGVAVGGGGCGGGGGVNSSPPVIKRGCVRFTHE